MCLVEVESGKLSQTSDKTGEIKPTVKLGVISRNHLETN